MMAKKFTRRCPVPNPETFEWLVLVGHELTEMYVYMAVPCERTARLLLGLPRETPILVGCPPRIRE